MPPLSVFGITSDGLNLFVNLLILSLIVVYLATVYWTYADARRRMTDPMLIGCATAASVFPFVGTIVYLIVRPPEYLEDIRERELEMQAAEARLHSAGFVLCPHCDAEIERDFLRCPSCQRRLKEPCRQCSRPLDSDWRICPYCEAEVAPPAPKRAGEKRGRSISDLPRGGAARTAGDRSGASKPATAAARKAGTATASGARSAEKPAAEKPVTAKPAAGKPAPGKADRPGPPRDKDAGSAPSAKDNGEQPAPRGSEGQAPPPDGEAEGRPAAAASKAPPAG